MKLDDLGGTRKINHTGLVFALTSFQEFSFATPGLSTSNYLFMGTLSRKCSSTQLAQLSSCLQLIFPGKNCFFMG